MPAKRFRASVVQDDNTTGTGIELPFNYWTLEHWHEAFDGLSLEVDEWRSQLHLYPVWARWAFERSLHFVARLTVH